MANNRVISMFYEIKDVSSKTILETNFEAEPIIFITGFNQVLSKLEDSVLNVKVNEEIKISLSPSEGFGDYKDENIQALPKEQFAGIELQEGMELFGQAEDGTTTRVIVKAIGEDEVMVDFNHPYAGKELEIKALVSENREATENEIAMQRPDTPHSCGCKAHKHSDDEQCCNGAHHEHGGHCCGKHH